MSLSHEQKLALDRARARVAEEAIVIERTFFGERFTLKFLPTLSQPALEIVGRVQEMASDGSTTVTRQFEAVTGFMDVMALPDTAELIGELAKSGIMTINDLVDVQMEVVQQVSGRPTSGPSSSAEPSPVSGESSTASAPGTASMQAPSPSTGS